MKKLTTCSTIFAFILYVFVCSCSFLQKEESCFSGGSFVQRKYYDFPRSKHTADATQYRHTSMPSVKIVSEKIIADEENSSPAPVVIVSADSKKIIIADKKTKPAHFKSHITKTISINDGKTETPLFSFKKYDLLKFMRKKIVHFFPSSDAMLILEIILAVILPPLAVFVKDNNVSTLFLVTLILWLIAVFGVAGFATGLGGLLWFAAAIIAILHIFDVI